MESSLAWVRFLHILGATLFVGDILVTAVWKYRADRTRNPRVVAFGQRMVTLTDFAFTGPGAALVLFSGGHLARLYGDAFLETRWLVWGIGLFVVSGLLWSAVLVPLQIRQAGLARQFTDDTVIPEQYWRLGRIWNGVGLVATILPLINLYLMVVQP